MPQIPNDPVILLSFINTELRDRYPTLDRLCAALSLDRDAVTEKLLGIGYQYDPDANQFL